MIPRCPSCHAPQPGRPAMGEAAALRCAVCGVSLGGLAPPPSAGMLIEEHSRQIDAARRAWSRSNGTAYEGGREEISGLDAVEYREAVSAGEGSSLSLEARSLGVLNLLLLHAGFSPWTRLAVEGRIPAAGTALRVVARPAAFAVTTLPISAEGELELPVPAPDYELFEDLDEAVRGELSAEVVRDGRVLAERRIAATVQPANQWIRREGAEAVLAGAVTPNAPAVSRVVGGLGQSFLAYQTGRRGQVRREVESLYEAVRGLDLRYLGAPPSYEGSGQKVLFPDQVLAAGRGCCLDLTVLQAALLERLGLHPLILLVRDAERRTGHACCAVWTSDIRARSPVLKDRRVVEDSVASGDLLVWNSTQPFEGANGRDFASALVAGERWLPHLELALDVAACRADRFKPVPRRGR